MIKKILMLSTTVVSCYAADDTINSDDVMHTNNLSVVSRATEEHSLITMTFTALGCSGLCGSAQSITESVVQQPSVPTTNKSDNASIIAVIDSTSTTPVADSEEAPALDQVTSDTADLSKTDVINGTPTTPVADSEEAPALDQVTSNTAGQPKTDLNTTDLL